MECGLTMSIPAYRGRKNTSVQLPSSLHTLSLRGADNPSLGISLPGLPLDTRQRGSIEVQKSSGIRARFFPLPHVAIPLADRFPLCCHTRRALVQGKRLFSTSNSG